MVAFVGVAEKAMSRPSALVMILVVILLVHLAMLRSTFQQLFHLDGRELGHADLIE